MRSDRRGFLKSNAAIAASAVTVSSLAQGQTPGPVENEMQRRLKFLSPPDGSPPDLLARPSPPLTPFLPMELKDFRPPVAIPFFEMVDGSDKSDEEWWDAFLTLFKERAEALRTDGFIVPIAPADWTVRGDEAFSSAEGDRVRIELGDPPDPSSHQRFFEFRPQKFYINREVEFLWKFHEQYGDRSLSWGYHNIYWDEVDGVARATRPCSPGPTFHARYGEPILVRRINDLPEIGPTDGHSKLRFALPSTTSHLHNAHTASESDGYPGDWINPGEYWDHHYANFPSGFDDREKLSTLWYHDHRMDFTASNVYAGLDGFYLLFDQQDAHDADGGDPSEESWLLPSHEFDIPLIFHDLLFAQEKGGEAVAFGRDETTRWTFESKQDWDNYTGPERRGDVLADGTLKAIAYKGSETNYAPSPQIIFDGFNTDGIIGDRWTVNRRVQPKLTVEPRKYRLRLLNGGPSRFYELFLHAQNGLPPEAYRTYTKGEGSEADQEPTTELDHPFIVICGDGNFQPNPVLAHSIYVGVAQRVDVIVDFSKYADSTVYLVNRLEQEHGRGPTERKIDPKDYASDDDFYNANAVIAFDVKAAEPASYKKGYGDPVAQEDDPSAFPLLFREFPPIDFTEVRRERIWEFDYDGGLWTINGNIFDPNRVDAGIEQDSAEIWTFRNGGNGWHHPIHSHFTEFIILERDSQPFLQGTIQTELLPQERQLLSPEGELLPEERDVAETEAGSFVTRRRLDELFKMEGYRGRSAYGNGVGLRAEFLQHLRDTLSGQLDVDPDSSQIDDIIADVEAILDRLEENDQSTLIDTFLSGNFAETRFRSYDFFKAWVDLLPKLGLGSPKVDRFLGGARRDVALLLPNTEVTVFARWKDFMGRHVMHCHNVVHEDHAMMVRWDIVPQGHGFDTPMPTDEIAQSLGDPVETHRSKHIESHPEKGAHQPDDS